jgi:hypothetical protein
MPTQSSLGAGVLQTAMRLSICIGLSISTAVYGSASSTPQGKKNTTFPFEHAYLCSIVFAVVGLLCVPFMRIGMQGGKTPPPLSKESGELVVQKGYHKGSEHTLDSKTDMTSFNSGATHDSIESYFPRWSWEGEREWDAEKYRDGNVVYEVCIKCLAEQRVLLDAAHSNVNAFMEDGPGWS